MPLIFYHAIEIFVFIRKFLHTNTNSTTAVSISHSTQRTDSIFKPDHLLSINEVI